MLRLRLKKQFKKDIKRTNRSCSALVTELKKLIDNHLKKTGTVPEDYSPHLLKGSWKPHMECHVRPDFLLIWDVDWDKHEIILVRCGSHAELFG